MASVELICVLLVSFAAQAHELAVEMAVQIPPPANLTVEFDRDVRPILENSCFRCHGPERPKSGFRLNTRESALKGGRNNSDDIVPGDSERSRLIRYVARVEEDMAMPPEGKGEPLTTEQVSVLRAWIDQGASWGTSEIFPQSSASVSPTLRWISVSGDRRSFRELTGLTEGFGGGLEEFSIEQRDAPDQKFTAEGHFLAPEDDFQLKLTWTKENVGFIRTGFERWRRYYDDSGGFYPTFTPAMFDLNRDLRLDIGRAWIDFGLTLPDKPKVVLGYEFQFRNGNKSMLERGNVNGKNIYPAYKAVDENVHILKLDVTHEIAGWNFEDNARLEIYRDRTRDEQIVSYSSGPAPDALTHTREEYQHVQGMNTFRMEKQLNDWWFVSGGYLYSRLEGDSALNQSTTDAGGAPSFGNYWSDQVTLRREMHVVSAANMFSPVEGLSLSVGAQGQFARQEGFGDINLDIGDPSNPSTFFLQPGRVRSDLDESKASETLGLRFSRIPFTIVFAEARLEQDFIGQFEQETGITTDVFLRDTDYANDLKEYRAGFNISPWRWIALNGQFKRRDSDSDYNHRRDESLAGGEGYSALIRHRDIVADEFETKLVLRPVTWFKTTLTYRRSESDYRVATDPVNDPFYGNVSPGGGHLSGSYRGNSYGVSATVIPSGRCFFTATLLYSEGRTITANGEAPSVVPYFGQTVSVIGCANYALDAKTSLLASYSLSQSDYSQNNFADGLPLGVHYTQHRVTGGVSRQLTRSLAAAIRYSFFCYDEPGGGHFNDFTGHGIFATMTVRWP